MLSAYLLNSSGDTGFGVKGVESKKILKNFTEPPLPKRENRYIVYPNNDNKEKLRFYYGK